MIDYTPLLALLKTEEGVRYSAYKDSLGILTIGVGFNIDGDHGGGLDDTEIDFILQHRLEKAASAAADYAWFDALSTNRKFVVIDMIYNMGAKTFAQFHGTQHSIAVGDYEGASRGMLASRWSVQVGKRAERLARIMRTDEWVS